MLIVQRYAAHIAVVDGRDMDAAAIHQTVTKGQTFRTVMVTGDDQHRQFTLCKTAQKIIE